MSGCIKSKDWDPGSNEGKEKTSLDFCRTGISPGWFLSPPAMWWLSRSRAPQAPPPCCPSLPSFQSQVSLSLWVPSIHPHTLSLARHPQTLLPSCQLLEASRIKREQGGQQFPVPASATPLPSSLRLFNPPVSLENQEGGIAAMSEINILVWVRVSH